MPPVMIILQFSYLFLITSAKTVSNDEMRVGIAEKYTWN